MNNLIQSNTCHPLKRIFNMQLQRSMTDTRCRYHIDYIVACAAEDVSRSFLWKRYNLLTYVELLSLFEGNSYFCCIIKAASAKQ